MLSLRYLSLRRITVSCERSYRSPPARLWIIAAVGMVVGFRTANARSVHLDSVDTVATVLEEEPVLCADSGWAGLVLGSELYANDYPVHRAAQIPGGQAMWTKRPPVV